MWLQKRPGSTLYELNRRSNDWGEYRWRINTVVRNRAWSFEQCGSRTNLFELSLRGSVVCSRVSLVIGNPAHFLSFTTRLTLLILLPNQLLNLIKVVKLKPFRRL